MIKESKFILIIALSLFAGVAFAFISNNYKLSPQDPLVSFHSLSDIYNLAVTGATSTPTGTLSTTSSPTATTSHSTSEIYVLLANMVKKQNINDYDVDGNPLTIFGVVGSMAGGGSGPDDISSSTPSSLTPASPAGVASGYSLYDIFYLIRDDERIEPNLNTFPESGTPSNTMLTTEDIYTVLSEKIAGIKPWYIKLGQTLFGIRGTMGCTSNVDCTSFPGSAYCNYVDYNSAFKGCTSAAENDSYCELDEQCLSGYCDVNYNSCQPVSNRPCSIDSDCPTDYICDSSLNQTNLCIPSTNRGIGISCENNSVCASGVCGVCDNFDFYCPVCVVARGIGAPCSSNNDCDSTFCGYDSNVNHYCTSGVNGSYCDNGSQCASTYCDMNTSQCSDFVCTQNSDCVGRGGYCDSGTQVCTNGGLGASCGSDGYNECSSGFDCDTGVTYKCTYVLPCPSGYSDAGAANLNLIGGICVLNGSRNIGESCISNINCQSNNCPTDGTYGVCQ